MKWYPKLDEALVALENGDQPIGTRVWSHENPEFVDKSGKTRTGTRKYYTGPPDEVHAHLCRLAPDDRSEYEIIIGACHLYIDYDLPVGRGRTVADAHREFSAALVRVLAALVHAIDYHVLLAHIPGRKESMHVRCEFAAPDGAILLFRTPEDCQRVVVAAIRDSLASTPFETNPLFYPETIDDAVVHKCILDWGVYNSRRNFRMVGCVKPPKAGGAARGRLVDSADNLAVPTAPPSRASFLRNLICPPASDAHTFLDVSAFPDELDDLRVDAGTGAGTKRRATGASTARKNVRAAPAAVDSELDRWVASRLASALPTEHLRRISHGGALVFRTSSKFCPLKKADHKEEGNGYLVVIPGYPNAAVLRKCWKNLCTGAARVECELAGDAEYFAIINHMLETSTAGSADDLFD